jgi:nicotinamide phosphoribosyltransferase
LFLFQKKRFPKEFKRSRSRTPINSSLVVLSIAMNNIILLADSYKITHHLQYPVGTTKIYSYFESRGTSEGTPGDSVVFFGLQYIMKKYLSQPITQAMINEADTLLGGHFGRSDLYYRKGWQYIVDNLGGKLPIVIKAVPEGTVVGTKNVLFTIENTDDECFWLVNYLETILVQLWYPISVATTSYEMKKVLREYLVKTGAEKIDEVLELQMHDFGFRGASSVETAGIGAAAHLVNFKGTDTLPGLIVARDFYGSEEAAGISIPASEHSTITTWTEYGEVHAFENMIRRFGCNKRILACVSDSYDIYNAVSKYWGDALKGLILETFKDGGRLVIRPDSGKPEEVLVKILTILEEKFEPDMKKTPTGHKLLPPYLRIIQGDGIDVHSLPVILEAVTDKGWAAENLVFGSGGGLLQKVNRDTYKFAMKCSLATVNGSDRDVFKAPIGDPGKHSKRGRQVLLQTNAGFQTVTGSNNADDVLRVVFRNGELKIEDTLETIRARAKKYFPK